MLYVLDEPSIGLHQRDNTRLLDSLKGLRDLGNTVIVVEHDEEAIETADYVVDLGPAAGVHGGEIIAAGKPAEIAANPKSLTGQYLSGARMVPLPEKRRKTTRKRQVTVKGASGNNLKTVDASFPLGVFTCVTGVSGGGKSTLTIETLYKAAARKLSGASAAPAPYDTIEGLDQLDKIIDIDQSPSGAPRAPTRRPIPAPSPRSANGSPPCPKPRPAATSRPFLVQREGRTMRGLSGRRRGEDRDALPARRVCRV